MTTNAPTRRRPARLGGVNPLPPSLAELVPPAVRAASEAFEEALHRHRAAGAEAQAARQQVEETAREDRRVAASAVDAGEPVPDPAEPAARAKLAEAERLVPASEAAATARQAAYLDAVLEHREAILDATGEALDGANAAARSALDDLEAALLRRSTVSILEGELRDPGYLQGRNVVFNVREARKPASAGHVEALRAGLGAP